MKVNKTNTTDYLERLEDTILNDDNSFIEVRTSEYSKFSDYIINYDVLPKYAKLKKLFKGRNYKFHTLYDLNPFKIHPNTYTKLKKLNDEFVVYYVIFENGVSQKSWRNLEIKITECLYNSSGNSWSFSDTNKTNMYFEMVDFCIGAFKVLHDKRINSKLKRTYFAEMMLNFSWTYSRDDGTTTTFNNDNRITTASTTLEE